MLLADDNLVKMASMEETEFSSSIPPRLVLISSFVVSDTSPFILVARIPVRLEGLPKSELEASEILALEGELITLDSLLGGDLAIVLTRFFMNRGGDQLRSLSLRTDEEACEVPCAIGDGG